MFKFYLPNFERDVVYSEFLRPAVMTQEQVPAKKGTPMTHQRVVANVTKGSSNVDSLLIVHDMGTGKTCTAVNSIEQNINDGLYGMKRALVLNKGKAILGNFVSELVNKCTTRYNVGNERANRKIWSRLYEMNTFEIFAKTVQKMSDSAIVQRYNETFIVVDEVHNILNESGLVFTQLMRVVKLLPRKRLLLMTGTPVRDTPSDFLPIMNLLCQTSISPSEFEDEFIDENGTPKKPFLDLVKNRVSYLRAPRPDLEVRFGGSLVPGLNGMYKVHVMSPLQERSYLRAFKVDERGRGVYNSSRQAIRFVFPDGTFGSEGFDRYVVRGAFSPEMVSALRKYGTDFNSVMRSVSEMSAKYAWIIQALIRADAAGEKSIVYDELVRGSGLMVFDLLLRFVGFSKHRLLSSETTTNETILRVQKEFNSSIHGKNVSVILGSRVISEGFTFTDVIHEHLVPSWNYTETSQVIARGIRMGSHRLTLLENPNSVVTVYRHITLPRDAPSESSIDYMMTRLSERKQVQIDNMNAALQYVSITCNSFMDRNGGNCLQPASPEVPFNTTISTVYDPGDEVVDVLKTSGRIDVSDYDVARLQPVINVVNSGRRFVNSSGVTCVARYSDGAVYASPVSGTEWDESSAKYVDDVKPPEPRQAARMAEFRELVDSDDDVPNRQRYLEILVTAKMFSLPTKVNLDEELDMFSGFYYIERMTAVTWFGSSINKALDPMCLSNPTSISPWNEWKKCKSAAVAVAKSKTDSDTKIIEARTKQMGLSFYGQRNPASGEFCIKNIDATDEKDVRKRSSGKRCTNWNKQTLLGLAKQLQLDAGGQSRDKVCDSISKWLTDRQLVVASSSCGVQTKIKK
ncbi:hypothetical protein AV955_gp020 [Diadromus pulchellus ascovirus 4a]|uniref:Complete DpAV4 genome n=1 Tax=Diadromus pulchellus ascovirus 4a TaxID=158683 RepID=F2NYU9_9VIRU|nr:hypothetical protein AV955_gp020 [Diadromus pulchellus ascovirus 4a]CCA61377.1 unnamed protein product [Diadromus pulchellus ascovirus 4a]